MMSTNREAPHYEIIFRPLTMVLQ